MRRQGKCACCAVAAHICMLTASPAPYCHLLLNRCILLLSCCSGLCLSGLAEHCCLLNKLHLYYKSEGKDVSDPMSFPRP